LGLIFFDISCGSLTISTEDWLRLVERIRKSPAKTRSWDTVRRWRLYSRERTAERGNPRWAIDQMKRLLEADAEMIMV
jgi:hypothetical protein